MGSGGPGQSPGERAEAEEWKPISRPSERPTVESQGWDGTEMMSPGGNRKKQGVNRRVWGKVSAVPEPPAYFVGGSVVTSRDHLCSWEDAPLPSALPVAPACSHPT